MEARNEGVESRNEVMEMLKEMKVLCAAKSDTKKVKA